MPDAALQRLRRAQHPGHRRQARPADPQRHEHRRRPGRLRPGDRPARRAASAPTSAAATWRGAAFRAACSRSFRRSGSRASATSSARSRSPSTSASGPTTSSSRSPPTAPRCTRASARSRSTGTSPDGFDEVAAAEVFGEHLLGTAHRPPPGARTRGARADLQPRLLHLGRAAGRLARGLPGPARSRLLDAAFASSSPPGTS